MFNKGCSAWNKGKTGVYSKEVLEAWSKKRLGRPAWNKGRVNIFSPEVLLKMRLAKLGKPLSEIHKKRIGDALRGEGSPNWKGGRLRHGQYIEVKSPNHPRADSKGYVYEHRLVMEKYLGRILNPGEIVHHLNHVGSDNRIENLKLIKNPPEHNHQHSLEWHRDLVPNKKCKFCKKDYYVSPSNQKSSLYCSRKCQRLGHRNGKNFICPTCGQSFYRNKSKQKESATHYCSPRCWYSRT